MSLFRLIRGARGAVALVLGAALAVTGLATTPSEAHAAAAKKTVTISLAVKRATVVSGTRASFSGTVKYRNKKPAKKVAVRFQTRIVGTSKWTSGALVRTTAKGTFRAAIAITKDTQVRVMVANKKIRKAYSRVRTVAAQQKLWITSIPQDVEYREKFTVKGKTTPGLRGAQLRFTSPWTETESDDHLGTAAVSANGTFTASISPGTFTQKSKALNVWVVGGKGISTQKFANVAQFHVWNWYSMSNEDQFGLVPKPFTNGSAVIAGTTYPSAIVLSGVNASSGSLPLGQFGTCDKLRFTAGVDGASTDKAVTWAASVSANGTSLWSRDSIGYTSSLPVTLNIAGRSRLTFTARISDSQEIANPDSTIALGGAEMHCLNNWN